MKETVEDLLAVLGYMLFIVVVALFMYVALHSGYYGG